MTIVDQETLKPVSEGEVLAPWHVVHTKSRQEKAVERALLGQGVEVFLPCMQRTMFYGHRKRVVRAPLFSGYVFMRGETDDLYTAMNTRRIARIVPVFDHELLERELEQIRIAIDAEGEFLPASYLEAGTPARVTRGPLKGVEGIVEFRRMPNRLVLQIQTLGRATSLEIDSDLLERIED